MPKKLKSCVAKVKKQGNDESSAFAICSSSTGIKRKKGGGWTKGESTIPSFEQFIKEDDAPKVVINRQHSIWLSLHRKTIGGCAEALYEKIDELLTDHLTEQRMYERME